MEDIEIKMRVDTLNDLYLKSVNNGRLSPEDLRLQSQYREDMINYFKRMLNN